VSKQTVHFFEVEYATVVKGLPHSVHRAFKRDVINPHDGHILCDPNRAACGFSLNIHRNSRTVATKISRSRKILAALMTATVLGEFRASRMEVFQGRTIGRLGSLKSLRWKNFRWTGLGQRT
jgi:hypothetical protein